MAWTTPKTNWVATDYINYTDYERIRNNLLHLHAVASELYINVSDLDTMTAKTGFSNYPYASEWNALETNLHRIFGDIVTVSSIGTKLTFYDNGATPDYNELNRIESATLSMWQTMTGQYYGRKTLSFTLNGGDIQP